MPVTAARYKRSATEPFETILVERRELGPLDLRVDIAYAGICHSDLHHAHNDRGTTTFPIVPGHEIAGTVSAVGSEVTRFAVGDTAGVGCTIDSCRECKNCRAGLQQYCEKGNILTYNARDYAGNITYGGYSKNIVVDEAYVTRIPAGMSLQSAAPMMCAGITLYSPLRHWKAGPGKKVGIVGLGGLGHVGVQISAALGAETVVFNLSTGAAEDAKRFGAHEYRDVNDPASFSNGIGTFDLIISTVPANFDVNAYLNLLTVDGTFVNLGVPNDPLQIIPHSLLKFRRSISGSLSGGLGETQEMIDFCAEHGVGAEVEIITADAIDEAYERVARGDVRFRFVIDVSTIGEPTSDSVLQLADSRIST
ncbi:NAD(P)-dependent alcohol dehydrogenase [Rhodococcus koreensis]|uniref:NAD(P)-dependent alcohol dehydrogenase n=1 Tax=Rhodococcus koreensis TaxID=99653 RepID=UPI003670AA1C